MTVALWDALFPTAEQIAERDRIMASRFFLVRQGSLGEIFRCGLCKGKHAYLTLRCVEQPFSGAEGGLLAYYKVLGRPGAVQQMTRAERARLKQIGKIVEMVGDIPEIGAGHPDMARQAAYANALGERDAMIGSVALGILEPIPPALAQRLLSRINGRGGKLTVPGLSSEV